MGDQHSRARGSFNTCYDDKHQRDVLRTLRDSNKAERQELMKSYESTVRNMDNMETEREWLVKRYNKLCWLNDKFNTYASESASSHVDNGVPSDEVKQPQNTGGETQIGRQAQVTARDEVYYGMCLYELQDAQRWGATEGVSTSSEDDVSVTTDKNESSVDITSDKCNKKLMSEERPMYGFRSPSDRTPTANSGFGGGGFV